MGYYSCVGTSGSENRRRRREPRKSYVVARKILFQIRQRQAFSVTGYGIGEGLCGWNCRHSFGSGDGENNPYTDIETEESERIEKLEQRQRMLERRIRKTKRIVSGMQTAVEACKDPQAKAALQMELDRKSYLLQRQNAAYNQFCDDNDLRPLADRLRIARWGREQAAKARGAARRYQNAMEDK